MKPYYISVYLPIITWIYESESAAESHKNIQNTFQPVLSVWDNLAHYISSKLIYTSWFPSGHSLLVRTEIFRISIHQLPCLLYTCFPIWLAPIRNLLEWLAHIVLSGNLVLSILYFIIRSKVHFLHFFKKLLVMLK